MSEENTKPEKGASDTSAETSDSADQLTNSKNGNSNLGTPQIPADYKPVEVNVKSLLDAGAHFGHKVEKWNPKMLPYIYGQRNNIHIINLDATLSFWNKARKFVEDVSSRGGSVLFVGTKLQAQQVVKEAAERCGSFYVNNRWLGGTLSNFQTIKNSIRRLRNLEELLEKAQDESSDVKITKKEQLSISRQVEKLSTNLGGIREMRRLPDLIFIVDIQKESIAVAEARKLNLPVVALADTNVDPRRVNFPIPSNDDATRTIRLFADAISDAVTEGKAKYKQMVENEALTQEKVQTKPEKAANPEIEQAGAASAG